MTVERHNSDESHGDSFGHEANAINSRVVAITFAGVVVLMIAGGVVTWGLLKLWDKSPTNTVDEPAVTLHEPLASEPALDPLARRHREELRAEEDLFLNSYETLAGDDQVARIPIDRAMKILAAEGLPTREP